MWNNGILELVGTTGESIKAHYWVKRFEEPSEYGIDGGRISKLQIKIGERTVVNYDRGWDITPETEEEQAATYSLINRFN